MPVPRVTLGLSLLQPPVALGLSCPVGVSLPAGLPVPPEGLSFPPLGLSFPPVGLSSPRRPRGMCTIGGRGGTTTIGGAGFG